MESWTTDATSECRGWSPLPAWRGEAEDMRPARASLLLTLSSEWKGNGVSHDAHKDMKLMVDVGSGHP